MTRRHSCLWQETKDGNASMNNGASKQRSKPQLRIDLEIQQVEATSSSVFLPILSLLYE